MTDETITIRNADWDADNVALKKIRQIVFIEEQNVPVQLEWDNEDTTAQHCLAIINNRAVATARLQTDGQLGRMAVLKEHRKKGIGSLLLKHIISKQQDKKSSTLFLHAQKHAVEFYEKFHFTVKGEEFFEAGIPHYLMTFNIDN